MLAHYAAVKDPTSASLRLMQSHSHAWLTANLRKKLVCDRQDFLLGLMHGLCMQVSLGSSREVDMWAHTVCKSFSWEPMFS